MTVSSEAARIAYMNREMHVASPDHMKINVAEMLEGHRVLRRLASSPRHIVPGHDPLVAQLYPAARAGLEGIVMRLDVEPAA